MFVLKSIFALIILTMLSAVLTYFWRDQYTVNGWMGIGAFDFELTSFVIVGSKFLLITIPVTLVIVSFSSWLRKFRLHRFKVGKSSLLLLISLYIVFFNFKLGMNGVETQTDYKLSGIAYYLRAYIGLLIACAYVTQDRKISYVLVVAFCFVSGVTALSRFVGMLPLMLLCLRSAVIDKSSMKTLTLLLLSVSYFILVTILRMGFYLDFESSWSAIQVFLEYDALPDNAVSSSIHQIFLRLGLGRDFILGYEVAFTPVCKNFINIFLYHPCENPPYDFYNLSLETNRFYLASTNLGSLMALSPNWILSFMYALAYAMVSYGVLYFSLIRIRGSLIDMIGAGVYLLMSIFILIGPFRYALYLLIFTLILNSIYALTLSIIPKKCKNGC